MYSWFQIINYDIKTLRLKRTETNHTSMTLCTPRKAHDALQTYYIGQIIDRWPFHADAASLENGGFFFERDFPFSQFVFQPFLFVHLLSHFVFEPVRDILVLDLWTKRTETLVPDIKQTRGFINFFSKRIHDVLWPRKTLWRRSRRLLPRWSRSAEPTLWDHSPRATNRRTIYGRSTKTVKKIRFKNN